eukprot:Nitzschia sp. Nitz4//scaffold119_size111653//16685//19966//NITZ4_004178-RA/size111653-augustus-gene-0.220-mRNA-1//-1//CDS//3329533800//1786//frame0
MMPLPTTGHGSSWVDNLDIPVAIVDTSGRVKKANSRMAQVSRVSVHELVGRALVSLFQVSDTKALEVSMDDMVEGGISSTNCTVAMVDSATRYNVKMSHQGDDEIVCFLQEEECCPMKGDFPMCTLDRDGIVSGWNSQAEALTGYTAKECVGQRFDDLITAPKRFKHTLHEVSQGGTSKACYVKFLQGEKPPKGLLVSLTTKRIGTSQVGGFCAILSDASDLGEQDESSSLPAISQGALHEEPSRSDAAKELQMLLNSANTVVLGVDRSGQVNEWNDKSTEVTGFSAEDALGQLFVQEFISSDMQAAVEELLRKGLEGESTSNFVIEVRTKEDSYRYLLASTTPRRCVDNSIGGVVVMAQDVSKALAHDAAVADLAAEMRKLIETANVAIFGIDSEGSVNEWNDMWSETTGFSKEEAFGTPFIESFIEPSLRDLMEEVLHSAVEGHGTSNLELEFRTKAGEIRNLLVNVTPRRDVEDMLVGALAVAQDVTEAFQRDRAVAGMALELRQLIDTANAPIFGIDTDGNVNEWNRRTSEITGYSKEEAFDEPLVETFIAESMRGKVQEILESALQGIETSNYELEFVSKTGEPIFLLVNATTRRDPENEVVGVVGVAQDVTEDRKHEEALRQMQYLRAAQEAKVETERNMTAYFAHELRNPLGAIDSALSAMPDDMPDLAKSLISGMQLCTSFMSSIMNNLLDVRKMEEGKMELSTSPISLSQVLSKVHKMLLPSMRPGVQFLKHVNTEGKDWVLGDEHRIQQVMTNVITNAIKYTVTGSVTVTIGWEGDQVKFECVDTGPGIPKNQQETLFHRFVQRGGAPGTGLGLAIAKHLVDLTGGTIRFDSDPTIRPGTACVVLMKLSLCEAPKAVVEESTPLIEEKLSFLIIDDIKMNRMFLKKRIKKGIAPNAVITEAATGEAALEICGNQQFDVIVVDQYMEEAGGELVGTDVVFAMRRMRIDAVIIGCSGNDMGTQFFEAGADRVWPKPMPSNEKIIQDLRSCLNKTRTTG